MNSKFQWTRRNFMAGMGAIGGGLLTPAALLARARGRQGGTLNENLNNNGSPIVKIKSGLGHTGHVYQELGVIPLVNTVGTITVLGGSVMDPEVMELSRQGNEHCVSIDDLEMAAGKWMAKLCHWPAGYTGLVTSGCAAAIMVAYAGMMTEDNEMRIRQCPYVKDFPKTEVIIQKAHRYPFDHQIRQTGATLVEVETKQEMIDAINPRTVAIHFLHINADRGQVSAEETIQIAREHGVYSFNDASADVPPVHRLWSLVDKGWDFVGFSGGKDIRGPQATGLLIGKEKQILWALMNMSPQEDRIGRPCKVGKESLTAFLKALEIFVNQDYNQTIAGYDASAKMVSDALKPYGVKALPRQFNPNGLGNVAPHYSWQIPDNVNLTGQQVIEELAATRPLAIGAASHDVSGVRGRWPNNKPEWVDEGVLVLDPATKKLVPQQAPTQTEASRGGRRRQSNPKVFGFAFWQCKPGEDKLITDRLVEIFSGARKS